MNMNDLVRDWFDIIKDTPFDKLHWYIDIDGNLPIIRSMNTDKNWWDNLYCCYDKANKELDNILDHLFETYKYYIEMTEDRHINNGNEYMVLKVNFANIPEVYRCAGVNIDNRRCKKRITVGNYCHIHN